MNFLLIETLPSTPATHITFVEQLAAQMGRDVQRASSFAADDLQLEDADILFISCQNSRNTIQRYLSACRELRIPYVFLTDTMQKVGNIKRIIMPISMLEEEVYKAEISIHIARYTEAETILLQANDYGTKAEKNIQKIATIYQRFPIKLSVHRAKKDSFGITKEVSARQKDFVPDLSILTASREYGLDDILFGPAERYAIMHSIIPVMLINPRGDLFALCD